MIWRLIDSGDCDAAYNMALDEAIALTVKEGYSPPTLRFYGWDRSSVTLGSFQRITDIDVLYCSENNIPIVRRPTGGRGILHGDELTYSFSSKNEGIFSNGLMEAYRALSAVFAHAFHLIGLQITIKNDREPVKNLYRSPVCFESTSIGEISLEGKKIIGSAQKRWKEGFLQQGSIPYCIDRKKLAAVFKTINRSCETVKEEYFKEIIGLREIFADFSHERLKEYIVSSFEEKFGVTLFNSQPSPQERSLALLLYSEKYHCPQWNLEGIKNNLSCNNNEIQMKAL